MKKLQLLAAGIAVMAFTACSSQEEMGDDLHKRQEANQPHTCALVLTASKPSFDDDARARSAAAWEEGDKIYLTFTVGTETVSGDAVYSGEDWTVNYYGTLAEGATGDVKAVYFEDAGSTDTYNVIINRNTAIYEDAAAKYAFSDNTLSITAALTPKTGRMRFAGESEDEIKVHGIVSYTSYDNNTGSFTKGTPAFTTIVASDGYTPYVYGEFENTTSPRLIIITTDWAYTRDMPSSIFKSGESGFVTIPTLDSHNGWANGANLMIEGVELKMLPVKVEGSALFLMAETETTEDLYCAINGGKPAKGMPKIGLTSSSWNSFVSNMRTMTGLNFQVPTTSEWITAASGAGSGERYTYSGSNNLDEVGWYDGNSGDKLHPVKQLNPNVLGLYDMSGNAFEYCYYGTYSDYGYYYGGCYSSPSHNCTTESGTSGSIADRVVTLRLCIR